MKKNPNQQQKSNNNNKKTNKTKHTHTRKEMKYLKKKKVINYRAQTSDHRYWIHSAFNATENKHTIWAMIQFQYTCRKWQSVYNFLNQMELVSW